MIEYMRKQQGETECPVCRTGSLRERDLRVLKQDEAGSSGSKGKEVRSYPPSTKVMALLKALKELRQRDAASKSVIFSQWTSMLDLLEEPLVIHGFTFLRLDGTVPQAKREEILQQFRTVPTTTLLLVSLRAGGVGLNLTVANNCFLLDLWWNPAGMCFFVCFRSCG